MSAASWIRERAAAALLNALETKDAPTRRASSGGAYIFGGQAYSNAWDVDKAVKDGFEKVIWVAKAIDAIADKASSWPLGVMEGDEPDWRPVKDDPILPLLNQKSNEVERSAKFFRYRLSSQLLLSKAGVFVEVVPTRGLGVAALNLLPPGRTKPVPDPDTFLAGFEVTLASGEKITLPVYDPRKRAGVIWIRKPHPTDPYSGTTPLEAAGISIDLDFYARLYNRNFLLNDGRSGQLVAVKGGLSPEDAQELKARFSPGIGGVGRTTVIEADAVTVQDTAMSPRDAQYAELRAITKEDLLIALGTPESVLGNASGRTFDNADAELENWLSFTVLNHCAVIESGLDVLTKGGWDDDRSVVHDVSREPVLQRAQRAREDRALARFQAGMITLDELREECKLKPLPTGVVGRNVLWIPAGLVPVGELQDLEAVHEALKPLGEGGAPEGAAPAGELKPEPELPPGMAGGPSQAELAAGGPEVLEGSVVEQDPRAPRALTAGPGASPFGKALELKASPRSHFNPDQPRYPSGHPYGGRWMDTGDTALWLAGLPLKNGMPSSAVQTPGKTAGSTAAPGGNTAFSQSSNPLVRAASVILTPGAAYPYARVLNAPAAKDLATPKPVKTVSLRAGDVVDFRGRLATVASNKVNKATGDHELELVVPDGTTAKVTQKPADTFDAVARTPHPSVVADARRVIAAEANGQPIPAAPSLVSGKPSAPARGTAPTPAPTPPTPAPAPTPTPAPAPPAPVAAPAAAPRAGVPAGWPQTANPAIPTPFAQVTVYRHPQGKEIHVYPSGAVDVWNPNGTKGTSSATAAKLAAGHGAWVQVPNPAAAPAPTPAPAARPVTPPAPSVATPAAGSTFTASTTGAVMTILPTGGALVTYPGGQSPTSLSATQVAAQLSPAGRPSVWQPGGAAASAPAAGPNLTSAPAPGAAFQAAAPAAAAPILGGATPSSILTPPPNYPYPVVPGAPVATALASPKPIKVASLRKGDVLQVTGPNGQTRDVSVVGTSAAGVTVLDAQGNTATLPISSSGTATAIARTPHPTVVAAARRAQGAPTSPNAAPTPAATPTPAPAPAAPTPAAFRGAPAMPPNGTVVPVGPPVRIASAGVFVTPRGRLMTVSAAGDGTIQGLGGNGPGRPATAAQIQQALATGSWHASVDLTAVATPQDAVVAGPGGAPLPGVYTMPGYAGGPGATIEVEPDGSATITPPGGGRAQPFTASTLSAPVMAQQFVSYAPAGGGTPRLNPNAGASVPPPTNAPPSLGVGAQITGGTALAALPVGSVLTAPGGETMTLLGNGTVDLDRGAGPINMSLANASAVLAGAPLGGYRVTQLGGTPTPPAPAPAPAPAAPVARLTPPFAPGSSPASGAWGSAPSTPSASSYAPQPGQVYVNNRGDVLVVETNGDATEYIASNPGGVTIPASQVQTNLAASFTHGGAYARYDLTSVTATAAPAPSGAVGRAAPAPQVATGGIGQTAGIALSNGLVAGATYTGPGGSTMTVGPRGGGVVTNGATGRVTRVSGASAASTARRRGWAQTGGPVAVTPGMQLTNARGDTIDVDSTGQSGTLTTASGTQRPLTPSALVSLLTASSGTFKVSGQTAPTSAPTPAPTRPQPGQVYVQPGTGWQTVVQPGGGGIQTNTSSPGASPRTISPQQMASVASGTGWTLQPASATPAPAAPTPPPAPQVPAARNGLIPGAVYRNRRTGATMTINRQGGAVVSTTGGAGNAITPSRAATAAQQNQWQLASSPNAGPSAASASGGAVPARPLPALPDAAQGSPSQVSPKDVKRGETITHNGESYVVTEVHDLGRGQFELFGYRPGVDDGFDATTSPSGHQAQGVHFATSGRGQTVTRIDPAPIPAANVPPTGKARSYDPAKAIDQQSLTANGQTWDFRSQLVAADKLQAGDVIVQRGQEQRGSIVVTKVAPDSLGRGQAGSMAVYGQALDPTTGQLGPEEQLFLTSANVGGAVRDVAVQVDAPTPTPVVPRPPGAASATGIVRNDISDPATAQRIQSIYNGPPPRLSKAAGATSVGDQRQAHLNELRGFNAQPDVVTDAQLDQHIAAGEVELWRGISPGSGVTAEKAAEDYRTGEHYPGGQSGTMYGTGTYTAYGKKGYNVGLDFARGSYASGARDVLVRMSLKSDARIGEFDTLEAEMAREARRDPAVAKMRSMGSTGVGHYATYKGYDAVRKSNGYDSSTTNPTDWGYGFLVVLNRSAIRVSESDYVSSTGRQSTGTRPRVQKSGAAPAPNAGRAKHQGTTDTNQVVGIP